MPLEQLAPEDHVNSFSGVISVIDALSKSLDSKNANGVPNWQRIAEIAKFSNSAGDPEKDPAIVSGVKKGTKLALVPAVFGLVKLVIKTQTMLEQLDSAKALGELSANLLDKVARSDFFKPFEEFGVPNPFPSSNGGDVQGAVATTLTYANKFPSQDDLNGLSTGLAKLIVLKYNNSQIDLGQTGKIRLLWWALADKQDTLLLPFSDNANGEELAYKVSSYWLGSYPGIKSQVECPLNLQVSNGLYLFVPGRTPDFDGKNVDSIVVSLGYKDYLSFKRSIGPNATDEVALNRLWGVDTLSDPNSPKLAPLPKPVADK